MSRVHQVLWSGRQLLLLEKGLMVETRREQALQKTLEKMMCMETDVEMLCGHVSFGALQRWHMALSIECIYGWRSLQNPDRHH